MTVRNGPIPGGQATGNRQTDPDAAVAAGNRDATVAEPVNSRHPGRLLLVVAALVLGIGSCQLPQPHLPKLLVGAAAGGIATTIVHDVPMRAWSGRG